MGVADALLERARKNKLKTFGKLVDDLIVLKPNYEMYKTILENKVRIKNAQLSADQKEMVQNYIENHVVNYVLNNPKITKVDYFKFEKETTDRAINKYETHKEAVDKNFYEENKALIEKVENYERLKNTIATLKEELQLDQPIESYRIAYTTKDEKQSLTLSRSH